MILLIDNYDSFSYNLVQMLGEILRSDGRDPKEDRIFVIRNDEMSVNEVEKLNPTHIILSPGPGKPSDAGICIELVRKLAGKSKILGVCLGHQAICETFGATITYAKKRMHGKQSMIQLDTYCRLFEGLKEKEIVGRYHSLAANSSTIPAELEVIAVDDSGEVMAVKHKQYEIYGVQFHPESVLTPHGKQLLKNFLKKSDDVTQSI